MKKSGAVSLVIAFGLMSTLHADSVTLGSATASGLSVVVPIYVRDTSGTPLGADAGAGNRIQSLAFKVTFPAASVSAATISRSGITQSLSPIFESSPSTSGSSSYIASFQETSNPIPFTPNAPAPGDEVAKLTITLSAAAIPGSAVTLTLDSGTTSLSNQNGTVSESAPSLGLTGSTVTIPTVVPTLTPPDQQLSAGGTGSLALTISGPAPSTANVTISATPAGIVSVPASVSIASGTTAVSFSFDGLKAGTATVTATLPASFGGQSTTATVRVIQLTPPGAPSNLAPANGATGITSPASLRWAAAAGATYYDIYFGTSTNPPFYSNSATTAISVLAEPATKYYWKVSAVSLGGSTPGPIWSFTAQESSGGGNAPGAPANSAPADGVTGVVGSVTLRWSAASNATRYDVYFGTQANPPLLTSATTTQQVVTTAAGTKYYWRVIAANASGTTSGPIWSFTTQGSAPNCPTPAVPVISAPAEVLSGQSFTIHWNSVSNATEYLVEESSDAGFATKTSTTVASPSTQTTFTRSSAQEKRFYYRVLAHRVAAGCDTASAYSTVATVVIKLVPGSQTRVIVVAGSTAGNLGSFFRTSLQLHNPGTAPISGSIIFHNQGTSGTGGDPKLVYMLGPRETKSYPDVLVAMGVQGLGSLDLVTDSGLLPRVAIRVYNDGGSGGTSGMTLPLIRPEDALTPGKNGVLIAPPDASSSRFNLGFRTLGEQTTFTLNLIGSAGTAVKSVPMTLAPNYFIQRPASDILGTGLVSSDVIEIVVTKGALIAYGATTDNITQDASIQIEVAQP